MTKQPIPVQNSILEPFEKKIAVNIEESNKMQWDKVAEIGLSRLD